MRLEHVCSPFFRHVFSISRPTATPGSRMPSNSKFFFFVFLLSPHNNSLIFVLNIFIISLVTKKDVEYLFFIIQKIIEKLLDLFEDENILIFLHD